MIKLSAPAVLITRAHEQCWETVNLFSKSGFIPYCLPLIESIALEAQFTRKHYDCMLFTSPTAVRHFAPYRDKISTDTYIAVGSVTAEAIKSSLEGVNIIIPDIFSAEGIEKKLAGVDLSGKNIVAPGPAERVKDLSAFFEGKGAVYEAKPIYKTVPVRYKTGHAFFFSQNEIDVVCFFSPSAVHSFFEQGSLPDGIKAAAVGLTTAQTLEKYGVKDIILPEQYTAESLAEAIKISYNVPPRGGRHL